MTTAPTFACVIPTHNRHDFLRESLASILGQSVRPHQVIVVSDIQDPGAEEICRELAEKFDFTDVTFIHDPAAGNGASASRNRGGYEATTDFIGFLDDDDLWKPNLLEAVAAVLATHPVDLVAVNREIFSAAESHIGPRIEAGLKASDVAAASLGTTGSNMIVSRAAFRDIGGFDAELPVKNDTDFFFRFLLAGYRYAVVPELLVRQRKHGLGQLTTKNERRARGTELYIAKHREHLSRRDLRKLRLTIHRIRRASATTFRDRSIHLLGALANYSIADFVRERREWRMWHQGEA
ncbi:glycosyltransferase family 2 protein [Microbacterium proteolyticum]|jgi:GT2 family glycosyltransferase|uniref:glycosyltransferase family 2 protein n=1 Tax=Microbacterium proteolyticum TaxID=1572644 RepID=UPI0035C0FF07